MKKAELYLKIVKAYKEGLKYRVIERKYHVSRWDIQSALFKAGVKTNRIRSSPRLPGERKRKKKRFRVTYKQNIYSKPKEDNNPVRVDDLDIMERIDEEGD